MNISVEHIVKIHNDTTGERWDVGPDKDGLDLVEINYLDKNKECGSLLMPQEVAHELAKAIQELFPRK